MINNTKNIIEMKNVGIRYDRGPEILSDINLSLPSGSFHFLTGQSGAGKTSLLSLMYLKQRPSRGQISVFDHNLNFTNRDQMAILRRRIGVVFQDFRLWISAEISNILKYVEKQVDVQNKKADIEKDFTND